MDCTSFGLPTSPPGQLQVSPQTTNSIRVSVPNLGSIGSNGSGGGKSYNQTTTPVKCEFCNYETTHRANMYRHKRTHFGVKNYECSVCGVMTTRSDNLRQHMLAKHGFVAPHISHSASVTPDIILPAATAQLFNNNNNTK